MPNLTRKSRYAFLPPLARQGRGGTVQRVQDVVRDAIVPRADATLLAALDRNLREQEAALGSDHRGRFHELDLELHELLLGFLGYERVKNAVEAARASLDRARLFMCTPTRQVATFAEHKAIVAALKKRDPEAAVDAMRSHLDAVMTELVDFAGRNPDAVAQPARDRKSTRLNSSHPVLSRMPSSA